jgi:hypothetical protein
VATLLSLIRVVSQSRSARGVRLGSAFLSLLLSFGCRSAHVNAGRSTPSPDNSKTAGAAVRESSEQSAHDHAAMGHTTTAPAPPAQAELRIAIAAPGQTKATLQPDAFDAPASSSIEEAARAAALTAAMAGHSMGNQSYVQKDAGKDAGAASPAPPAARPSPDADPHRHHMPKAPSPAPSPASGHEGHERAAPRTRPSPSPKPMPTPTPRPMTSPLREERFQ